MTTAPHSIGWSTRQKLTLVATGLGLFMVFMDVLIVNVALPDIQKSFGVGESGVQWVVAAYSIGMAIFMMTSATFADHFGRRRLFVIGLTVFALSSMVCGLAPSIAALNVSRFVQGLSAATVNVTSLALVSAAFPDPKQKAKAVGLWTAIASTAIAIGPTVGGFLTESVGWEAVFYVNVPVAIIAIVIAIKAVAESKDPVPRGFDLPGQALFIVAIGAFAFALIQGQTLGWGSPTILACFAAAAVGLGAFIVTELKVRAPMMDVCIFSNRTYSIAIVAIFIQFFAVYGMLLLVTQFYQSVRGYTPEVAGFLVLPFSAGIILFSPLAGIFVGKYGTRVPIVIGETSMLIGLCIILVGLSTSVVLVPIGLGFVSVGGAFTLTPVTSLAMTSVPAERAGMASGIMSAQRAIGSTAGYAVMGAILAIWLGSTVNGRLETEIPDPVARREVAAVIIKQATPHAVNAEVGPGRPLGQDTPLEREAIERAAGQDFERGMQIAIGFAIALSLVGWFLTFFGLPRGHGAIAAAESEAEHIEAEEDS